MQFDKQTLIARVEQRIEELRAAKQSQHERAVREWEAKKTQWENVYRPQWQDFSDLLAAALKAGAVITDKFKMPEDDTRYQKTAYASTLPRPELDDINMPTLDQLNELLVALKLDNSQTAISDTAIERLGFKNVRELGVFKN